jgi:hypothetical protein
MRGCGSPGSGGGFGRAEEFGVSLFACTTSKLRRTSARTRAGRKVLRVSVSNPLELDRSDPVRPRSATRRYSHGWAG